MQRDLDKPIYCLRASLSMAIGFWLMANALTFYPAQLDRVQHDILIGLLLLGFGCVYGLMQKFAFKWIFALIGLWLQISTLVIPTEGASTYFSITLSGILVLCLATAIPDHLPLSQAHATPHGWSFNPSTWMQRAPSLFFIFISYLILRYISAYELGFIPVFFDPLTNQKIDIAKMGMIFSKEIPDASLAVILFSTQLILGCSGGHKRWFEAPWAVIIGALLNCFMVLASIALVLLYTSCRGALNSWWLTLMLLQIASFIFSIDETVASLQFMQHWKMRTGEFWKNFWKGGCPASFGKQTKLFAGKFREMVWGISTPWPLVINACIGIGLFCDSLLFPTSLDSEIFKKIAGVIIFSFSCLAMAEVMRFLRSINYFISSLLIFLPWFIPTISSVESLRLSIAGLVIGYTLRFRGKIHESYGNWNRYIV